MTANEFVQELKRITPERAKFENAPENFSEDFIDDYLTDLSIRPKATADGHTSSDDAVIDLILNYDISKLTIQIFSFNDENEVSENEKYIYCGRREAFPFAILKETGEIVEVDWADPDYIVSYIAKDQSSFLRVLIELEKLNQERMFGEVSDEERRLRLSTFGKNYAGGEKYNPSYMDL